MFHDKNLIKRYIIRNTIKFSIIVFFCFFSFNKICLGQTTDSRLYISFYNGILAGPGIEDALLLSADFDDSYQLYAFAISKKIGSLNKYIDMEIEGQIVKHIGEQHHLEFNPVFLLRWLSFPWNQKVNTTFAIGEGLSYATKTPEIEKDHNEKTSRLLNYLLFEFTFSLKKSSKWHLITRVHHRSGMYGLFSGVTGASNAVGIGLRYCF